MNRVLLIDDDTRMIDLYTTTFEDDYEVVVVSNSNDALEMAKTTLPHVILLDMMMPGYNGLQILEQLKAEPLTTAIPVVILSNLSEKKYQHMCLEKGAAKYCVKSDYEPEALLKEINHLLQ